VRNLLEKRKARRKEQRFVVEGPHLVEEAGGLIDFVIYSEELPVVTKLRDKGIDCYKTSRKQFSEISEVETPQGILAVVREQQFGLRDVLGGLVVFCIGVQDPGNLGTIIRTADAVAASGVILSRGTVDLYNAKVIRSTMGSLFHLPIVHVDDVPETIEYLKNKKIRIVATDIAAKKDYWEADLKSPSAILVGNEAAGLSGEIVKISDETVKVPMPGKAESLNVAMCTSIVLYEVLRQRYARQN